MATRIPRTPNGKQWIVFETPDGRHEAIVSDFTTNPDHDQVQELYDHGNRIKGFVYFETKTEAVRYVEDCGWKGN